MLCLSGFELYSRWVPLFHLGSKPVDSITPPWLAQQRNPVMSPQTKGNKQAPVTLKNISGERTLGSKDVLVKTCMNFDVCEQNNSSSSVQCRL